MANTHTRTHTHTHTQSVPRDTQGGWSLVQGSDAILTHVCLAPPLIKLMGCEHRENAVGLGGAGDGKHTHTHTPTPTPTHTHTHTHSVPRDTQGGWSFVQGSDAILTHVCLAPPLIKLMAYDHRENAVWLGEQVMANTHTRTHPHTQHTHTQCPS